MKKYAIATRPESDSGNFVRVYSDSYDTFVGRSTFVTKNLLGQWSLAGGERRPRLWSTRAGAENSKTMGMLRQGNANVRVIEIGPTNEEIRERAAFHVDEILSVLAAASMVPGSLSDKAETLIRKLTQ